MNAVDKDDVLAIATERFERRLSEESGKLRQEISALRAEMKGDMSLLREDVTRSIANVRVETIKWSFVFWATQMAAIAALFLRE